MHPSSWIERHPQWQPLCGAVQPSALASFTQSRRLQGASCKTISSMREQLKLDGGWMESRMRS